MRMFPSLPLRISLPLLTFPPALPEVPPEAPRAGRVLGDFPSGGGGFRV